MVNVHNNQWQWSCGRFKYSSDKLAFDPFLAKGLRNLQTAIASRPFIAKQELISTTNQANY
jgi:hypothetical protein